jgi:hypothetical protein
MNGAASDLREMLAQGWEITGFEASITQLERASETDGYAILMKRGPDLAIATVMYTDEGLKVDQIHYLTAFKD